MTLPVHWVNGTLDAGVAVNDRGFSFGDSVFETFRIQNGRAHLWQLHALRLRGGLDLLHISCAPARIDEQLQQGFDWLQGRGIDSASARLTVSRGPAERGYRGAVGPATVALQLNEALPWRAALPPLQLVVCETRLGSQPLLAGIKHGNRLEQVLGAREVERRQADEGLMCNSRGELVCAVSANLFVVRGDRLLTPPIEDCGIAGTVRQLIIDTLAAQAGIEVAVGPLLPGDLASADELLLTSSLQGIRSVAGCDGHSFTSTRWGDTLREHFFRACETAP
ncbi:MAG: aminodeoxychorismate lyase [Halieaceae bacterium]|nr:aminodeoxychorismate lyase [Halieaceae bacterium]